MHPSPPCISNSFIPPVGPLFPFSRRPPSPLSCSLGTAALLPVPLISLFSVFHRSALCILLRLAFSLSTVPSSAVCVVAWACTSFLLRLNSVLCVDDHVLPTHPLLHWWTPGCFHFGATARSGVMNVAVFTFLDHMRRSGKFCLTFKRLPQQHYFNTVFFFFFLTLVSLLQNFSDVHVYDKSLGERYSDFPNLLVLRIVFFSWETLFEPSVTECTLGSATEEGFGGRAISSDWPSQSPWLSLLFREVGYIYDFLIAILLSLCVK